MPCGSDGWSIDSSKLSALPLTGPRWEETKRLNISFVVRWDGITSWICGRSWTFHLQWGKCCPFTPNMGHNFELPRYVDPTWCFAGDVVCYTADGLGFTNSFWGWSGQAVLHIFQWDCQWYSIANDTLVRFLVQDCVSSSFWGWWGSKHWTMGHVSSKR